MKIGYALFLAKLTGQIVWHSSTISFQWYQNNKLMVLSIHLQGRTIIVALIKVYAPRKDTEDEGVEEFYEQFKNAVAQAKNQDLLIIMGLQCKSNICVKYSLRN